VPIVKTCVQRQDLRLMNAVVDIKPTTARPATSTSCASIAATWAARSSTARTSRKVQAAREKYSPIWGAWTGEFPQPNEWIHLWRYKNLEERFKARGDGDEGSRLAGLSRQGPGASCRDALDPADADELFAV
jgi:hypothetical protein